MTIKLLLLDVDGVITNGKVIIDEHGLEYKEIDYRDIDAIFELKRSGLQLGLITGEDGPFTVYLKRRFQPDYFFNGCKNKKQAINQIINDSCLKREEICFVGDGKYDIEAIDFSGLGLASANALQEVAAKAEHLLNNKGGNGAVREAVDYILNIVNTDNSTEEFSDVIINCCIDNRLMVHNILADKPMQKLIAQSVRLITHSLDSGGQLLFCGNGGSAADAQHLATELVSKFLVERRALNAEALTTNTSSLTAIGNDYGFSRIFARQVEAKAKPGDVLIGITTSGNSENVVEALRTAKELGLSTVTLTGDFNGTKCSKYSDILIKIPSKKTARIQEGHILIGHIMCELIENELCEQNKLRF